MRALGDRGLRATCARVELLGELLRRLGGALRQVPAQVGDEWPYLASKAGRSERIRGIRSKLRSGGGQVVAHSRELPKPHGSSTVTMRPYRQDFHTL